VRRGEAFKDYLEPLLGASVKKVVIEEDCSEGVLRGRLGGPLDCLGTSRDFQTGCSSINPPLV